MRPLTTLIHAFSFPTGMAQSTFRLQLGGAFTERFYSVMETPEGDLMVAGTSLTNALGDASELWVCRVSAQGDLLWSRFYGGPSNRFGGFLAPATDGHFWLCGATWSKGAGCDAIWLLKLEGNGDVVFETTFGTPGSEFPEGIVATDDRGVASVGTALPDTTQRNSMITLWKASADGQLDFTQGYGDPHLDLGRAVANASDGGFVLAGTVNEAPPHADADLRFFVVRTDPVGDTLCTRKRTPPRLPSLVAGKPNQVIQLGDGSFVAIGDMAMRLLPQGDIAWTDGDLGGSGAVATNDFARR